MRKLLFACMLLACTGALYAQLPPITPGHFHNESLRFNIASFEKPNWNGPLNINVQLIVFDSIQMVDSVLYSNPGFEYTLSAFNLGDSTYAQGDTVLKVVTIHFDTTYVPKSYLKLNLHQAFSQHSDTMFEDASFYVFFTPWRTIEIWNEGDFGALNRVWTHNNDSSSKVYINPLNIPNSDIADTFQVVDDWQDNMYDVFVGNLPFSIPMMAIHPDSLTHADTISANKKGSVWRFNGRVEGNITAFFSVDDDRDNFNPDLSLERPLAGLQVELWNVGGVFPMAVGESDADGNFDFTYNAWKESPLLRTYIKVKARNDEHDIRAYNSWPFLRVQRENRDFRWISWNGTQATEDILDVDERFDIGTFRAVSQCFLGYEFIENTTNYDLEDGLDIGVITPPGNVGGNFFWPDELCEDMQIGGQGIVMQLNGRTFSNPLIILNSHEEENTIWHEFGHFVMWQVQDHCWTDIVTSTDKHAPSRHENPRVEWTEGFASGIMCIIDLHYHYVDEESQFYVTTDYEIERRWDKLNGYISEYYLAMTMRDLFDGTQQVLSCHNHTTSSSVAQPMVVDIANPSNSATWNNQNDNFEFSLDFILDAVALGSDIDPDGNGQVSSIGEYFANLMQLASCEERPIISAIFVENRIGWRDETINPLPGMQNLSADRIGRNGDEEVRDGTNRNLEDIANGFNRLLEALNLTNTQVDFEPLNLDINELNSTTGDFNFPVSDCIIDDLEVTDNATLFLNSSTNGADWVDDANPVPSLNDITVTSYANIDIDNNGNLQVGDNTQTATLLVHNSLNLDGSLVINNNSYVIIESDGILNFDEGSIQLNGANAILEIKGSLNININATFTFSGSGKVIFNGAVPNNINFASGSSIEIIGNGSSHVAVEIHQNDLYALKNNNALANNNIHFEDCKILMADNARLATDLPIELRSVVVDRLGSTDEPRGFEFYGQNNVYVAGCTFSNCRYGIKANNHIGGAPITINNSTFTNCTSGLYTIGAGANLSTCNFNNNTENGWLAKGMYFESKLSGSNFNNNGDDGINFIGKHIGGLRLFEVTASNNGESGVDGDGYFFKSGCGHLQNNSLNGVIFRGNAMYLTNNKVKNTSRNYFDGNNNAITFNGYSLFIDEGRNDLQASGGQYNIKGEVWPFFTMWGAMKHNPIFCDNNIFDDSNAENFANGSGNCFVENVPMFGGGSSTMTNVVGSTLSDPIGACEFIEVYDPWNRNHSQALAYYSSRTAPVLVFENPAHEFHNLTIDNAVDETIEHFYDEQISGTAVLTISRASDILTFNFENELDDHSLTLYYDAYNIMIEAATKGIESGEIICNPDSSLPSPIQTVINTQNFMLDEINNGSTSDRYWHKYTISLNKAMIYRVARQHSQAINELNNMQSWVATADEVELDYITCHTQYELDLLDGTIDIYGVDLDSIYTCVDTVAGGGGGSVPFFSIIDKELNGQKQRINIYPNPSNGISTIEIKNANVNRIEYTIYTLSGQQVQQGNLVLNNNGIGNIDYQTLPKGVYLLKVNVNAQVQQLKLLRE